MGISHLPDPQANASSSGAGNLVRTAYGGSLKGSMQSVVVSITGYKGLERIRLIQLINVLGAAYTGKWTPSHTHLVCWNYSGLKFEMAKKSGKTILLNHRWLEECFKQNMRLAEHPYTLHSGEEVGPLRWVEMADEASTAKHCLQHRDLGKRIMEAPVDAGCSSRPVPSSIHMNTDQPLESRQEAGPSTVHGFDPEVVGLNGGSTAAYQKHCIDIRSASGSLDAGRLPDIAADEKPCILGKRHHESNTLPPRNIRRRVLKESDAYPEPTRIEVLREVVGVILANGTPKADGLTDPCTPSEARGSPQIVELHRQEARLPGSSAAPGSSVAPNGSKGPESLTCNAEVPVGQQVDETPAKLRPEAVVACVICYTERITDKEGVLGCGHKFCFPCINRWATNPKWKVPVCPLCKAPFHRLTKRNCSNSGEGDEEEEVIVRQPQANHKLQAAIVNSPHIVPPTVFMATTLWHCISCYGTDSQHRMYTCNFCFRRDIHADCIQPARDLQSWLCPPCDYRRRAWLSQVADYEF